MKPTLEVRVRLMKARTWTCGDDRGAILKGTLGTVQRLGHGEALCVTWDAMICNEEPGDPAAATIIALWEGDEVDADDVEFVELREAKEV